MTDRQIIELFLKRDENGIAETERLYGARLTRIAEAFLSREDAEECVSDTYLAAWNHIPPDEPVIPPDEPIIPDNPDNTVPDQPDKPLIPDQPTFPDKPEATPEDIQDMGDLTTTPDLRSVFPFCIPWDIYHIFLIFDTGENRKAPHIDFIFPGTDWHIDVDLAQFDPVAALLRLLELILFIVGLAVATRKLIGATG